MEFDLSEELTHTIIFSMEDQTDLYVLDSSIPTIVKKSAGTDDARFLELPEWDSLKGFKIRERFISLLRNPLLCTKLREVLFSGKSVFKNFKAVLKEYPEAEKLWFTFKNREMRTIVFDWYNAHREAWGLEKLGAEPEENEDLVYEDFVFRDYDSSHDENAMIMAVNEAMHEFEAQFNSDVGQVLAALWQNQRLLAKPENEMTFICETVDGEFAGFITVSTYPENAAKTVLLTTWFIRAQFRGFGLGRELLSLCLTALRQTGARWVILANIAIPHYISSVLVRSGFIQEGSVFIADLAQEHLA